MNARLENHAEQNAAAWYSSISEQVAALEGEFPVTIEGETYEDQDALRQRIQEGPLSVEVRSGWYVPFTTIDEQQKPEEFCILLSTGGPALRICGDLDEYGQPTRAYMQHQDWGTSWTDYYAGEGSGKVLLEYAQQFYFGE